MKAKAPACEIYCFNEEKVQRLRPLVHSPELSRAAQLFKVLADDTRMRIAYALSVEDELCVCDAANIAGTTMAAASHHLRLLHQLGLAKFRKEGKLVFYSLKEEQVKRLIQLALSHTQEGGKTDGEDEK